MPYGPSGVHVFHTKCPDCGLETTITKYAVGPDPYLPTRDGPPRPDLFPGIDIPGSPPLPKRQNWFWRWVATLIQ